MTARNLTIKVVDVAGDSIPAEAGASVAITPCDQETNLPRIDFISHLGVIAAPYESTVPDNGVLIASVIPSELLVRKSFYLLTITLPSGNHSVAFKMPDKDTDIASAVIETPGFRS